MKRGYKRLLIFEIIIFFILALNSFFWNVLGGYTTVIFLILTTIIFKKLFGFERDKHSKTKDVIFELIIFLLIFFILYYLFGIIIGFAKIDNYYNIAGITKFIIPLILTIILKEFLRYHVIMKSEGNKLLTVVSILLFVLIDVTNSIYYIGFNNFYNTFVFVALVFLPAISTNIICSYLTYKVGYRPNILYLLVINLYPYLIPIIPNPNEYIASLINFLLPITLLYKVSGIFKLEEEEQIERNYKKQTIFSLMIPTLIIVVLVYFTSGYFKYKTIAIASGSMEKEISKGDVVIIEKFDNNYNYDKLKEGQVIAYDYQGVIVVHRIIKIINDNGEYFVYTKGDANSVSDNYVVKQKMIIGTVKTKIPFVGLPTVWLNEL